MLKRKQYRKDFIDRIGGDNPGDSNTSIITFQQGVPDSVLAVQLQAFA